MAFYHQFAELLPSISCCYLTEPLAIHWTFFGAQAAPLTGLIPIAHDSGALRGMRSIGGGRRLLRHEMYQPALVASYHNPTLNPLPDCLRAAGKPHKVIIIAVARKLVTIANALCKSHQNTVSPVL